MDANRFFCVGRLTKDPEYRPAGRRGEAHTTFTVAINRVVPNEQGPQADYIPCSLWGEIAKSFCEERSKGDEVTIFGRIRTGMIQQPSGPPRFTWEVRVDKFRMGRRSLKNLQPAPVPTTQTRALERLSAEFGADPEEGE